MKRTKAQRIDVGLGAIVAALGLFVFLQGRDLDFYLEGIPGPGFFPSLLAVALAITGALLCLSGLFGGKDTSEDFDPPTRSQATRSLGVWVAMLASVLLVPVAGFLIAMLMLVGILIFGLEGKRNLRGLTAVILIPVAAHLLFAELLLVDLPTGVFGI
ncbi:MAG: tripartite tricarboxylate transporter TctB family protein [Actinomycetota bacterium]|nr:tripartite tricarboxylate transporter TctB family protein [Actinomycetota bacterium]